MRRKLTAFSLIVCGLWILLGALVSGASVPVASASALLAPSPRPTIERPTPVRPTAEAKQPEQNHSSGSSGGATATGRLTGTIIDATTGAPAAGITVVVGGVQVTSDANGNYDTWLPVGSYMVGLTLSSQQGTDLLGPQAVVVRSADTTVQHLYFRSPSAALPAPALVPTAAAPASAPAQDVASAGQAAKPALRPTRLPVTSVPGETPWLWLSLGVSLVLGGSIIGFGGRRAARRFNPNALLAALLNTRLPATPRSDEALLRSLLDEGE